MQFAAGGSVSDFTGAVLESLKGKIAIAAGVNKAYVTKLTVTAGSVIIFATIAVPGDTTAAAVTNSLNVALATKSAASAVLGVAVETLPTAGKVAPPPLAPPPPSPPPVCSDICNWSQLKVAPLQAHDELCAKKQLASVNAPFYGHDSNYEYDTHVCMLRSPGSSPTGCPSDYFPCIGNRFYTAPANACPEPTQVAGTPGNCGVCANLDNCGMEQKCQKKKLKNKCSKKKVQKKCGQTCAIERIRRAVVKERKAQKRARKAARKAATKENEG